MFARFAWQYNRYLYVCGDERATATIQDVDIGELGDRVADKCHRNHDEFCEQIPECTLCRSAFAGVPGVRRRQHCRLGVSRLPQLECCGDERENFYQQRHGA